MKLRISIVLPALVAVLSLAGCRSAKKEEGATGETAAPVEAPAGEPAVVGVADAPFYRYGPAQASGPDLRLSKGTLVAVAKKGKAYSSVKLPTGMAGFMITRNLIFGAEAAETAAQLAAGGDPNTALNQSVSYSSTARVAGQPAPSGAPQANAPDAPLPDSNNGAQNDIEPITPSSEDVKFPSFRY